MGGCGTEGFSGRGVLGAEPSHMALTFFEEEMAVGAAPCFELCIKTPLPVGSASSEKKHSGRKSSFLERNYMKERLVRGLNC